MNKNMSKTFCGIEDYEKNCYLFSPSVSKRKTVSGKAYFVRRYFRGGKDFEKTMETLAVQYTTQNAR
mgnify:FL=1